ncbi:hypothetical protein SAY86_019963 [Trapa natans]|uniref:REF/SRPP-like protein n=1 Tax=Trapa natans TaxID=22666 RepID=A0AAN7R1D3_TRANT|nr:hypothetical protein SAY86_019963 [Trapa natans]
MEKMEAVDRKKSYELKRLGLVRVAAIHALVCVSNLYDYAKRNSGPLRSTVGTVEGAVTAVAGPVYEKFKGVPIDVLVFVDQKVDGASHKFDKHAPLAAKKIMCLVHELIEIASQKTQKLVQEAQGGGLRGAFHYSAAELKQLLLNQSAKVWLKLNKVPPLHMMAEVAIPTAAHWSKKYNRTVRKMSRKGYSVFGYLPLVPLAEIRRAFKQGEAPKKEGKITVHESSSESD